MSRELEEGVRARLWWLGHQGDWRPYQGPDDAEPDLLALRSDVRDALSTIESMQDHAQELLAACKGVVREADRSTVAFDAAHAAIAKAEGGAS